MAASSHIDAWVSRSKAFQGKMPHFSRQIAPNSVASLFVPRAAVFIIEGMSSRVPITRIALAVPPQAWFVVSAVFHYLGPSFAVLLFPLVGALGLAWLRIASAALMLGAWTRPWRLLRTAGPRERMLLVGLGTCLAVMNSTFYLALERLPMSLVAAIEFVGTIAVALYGLRSPRNLAALALAVAGVLVLIDVRWASDPLGLLWAGANGLLFVFYIVLGHAMAQGGAAGGVERLGAAMAIALVMAAPFGVIEALPAFADPRLMLAAIGVGFCSSVIPYVCDQLAMARLPRASFALLLALLPATATLVGLLILAQMPTLADLLGVALVMLGLALHQPPGPSSDPPLSDLGLADAPGEDHGAGGSDAR